jgi:membrane-associated protease RseP (regulator of RpoE activity)
MDSAGMKPRTAFSALLVICTAATLAGQAPQSPPASDDFVRPGEFAPLAAPLSAALGGLRASSIASHIAFLSAPSMEGRGLGGRGLEATAEYVAASLALAGVSPLTPAGRAIVSAPYFHAVPVREISNPSGEVKVDVRRGEVVDARTFLSGVDCVFPELPPEAFTAPVVFAGYGIRETRLARDDYRDVDVKDKIVLVFAGLPPGAQWQSPELTERYAAEKARERFAAKAELARSLGARGLLAIEGAEFAARLAAEPRKAPGTFFAPFDQGEPRSLPVVRVSPRVGDALLAAAGLTSASAGGERPRALPGVVATVRLGGDERLVASRNVVGIIHGIDPVLRDEAVILGAHMDHLGRIGDRLYPGADDNASGVAALLEIARAFAAGPHRPKRSLVFAFWTGEEEGHLGSVHYVRHPLWPLEKTSVYLNLDMIGHPWKAEEIRLLVEDARLDKGEEFLAKVRPADFLELGVASFAPGLGGVLKMAARGTGVALHLDRTDGKSGGSDYRDFARQGVPFVRFFGNYFDGYHEPTDTADKVDAGQVLKMAKLAFVSAWLFADR